MNSGTPSAARHAAAICAPLAPPLALAAAARRAASPASSGARASVSACCASAAGSGGGRRAVSTNRVPGLAWRRASRSSSSSVVASLQWMSSSTSAAAGCASRASSSHSACRMPSAADPRLLAGRTAAPASRAAAPPPAGARMASKRRCTAAASAPSGKSSAAQHAQHRKQGAAGRPRFAFAPAAQRLLLAAAWKIRAPAGSADSRLADHQNHAQLLPAACRAALSSASGASCSSKEVLDPGWRRADLLGGQAPGPGLTARRGRECSSSVSAGVAARADHRRCRPAPSGAGAWPARDVPGAVLAFAFEHRAAPRRPDGDAHARRGARHALPQRQRRTRRIAGGTLVVLRPAEQGRQAVGAAAGDR